MIYSLVLINVLSFVLYGIDKKKSIRRKKRISEFQLFFISFLGGSIGSILGMKVFHHKTLKWYFWFLNIVFLIVWCSLCINKWLCTR